MLGKMHSARESLLTIFLTEKLIPRVYKQTNEIKQKR